MRRLVVLAAAFAAVFAALQLPSSAGAQGEVIQPGVSITMGGSFCTLNWIYDGVGALEGRVFGGTAGHCVDAVGQEVALATGSLGEPIATFGDVAYIDDDLDYAFIEIRPEFLAAVNPSLKGHPEFPTGVSTTETATPGDLIQFSGHGVVFHLTTETQESRIGILNYNDGTEHFVVGPVSNGDSGGPVGDITDGNKALGIVNTITVGANSGALLVVLAGEGGLSLEGILADAAANGFPVALRTV